MCFDAVMCFTFYSHQSYLLPNSMFLPSNTSSIEKGAQRHITLPWFKSDGDVGSESGNGKRKEALEGEGCLFFHDKLQALLTSKFCMLLEVWL